jgi:hypothetical protein
MALAERASPIIRIVIQHSQPIEIGEFASAFASLGRQYHRYISENRPELSDEADLYVDHVTSGSIIAELLVWGPLIIDNMGDILVVEDFVTRWGKRLARYAKIGGRDPEASPSEVKDVLEGIKAIAHDPKGKVRLEAIVIEDQQRKIKVAAKFDTQQLKTIEHEASRHLIEFSQSDSSNHERVLMIFVQSNIKDAPAGKKSGERVVIGSISDRDLPLIYGSQIAEERIKHEIRDEDENVFKKGFVVDVIVDINPNTKRPAAYRVTNVHSVIDLPDDEG